MGIAHLYLEPNNTREDIAYLDLVDEFVLLSSNIAPIYNLSRCTYAAYRDVLDKDGEVADYVEAGEEINMSIQTRFFGNINWARTSKNHNQFIILTKNSFKLEELDG